MTSFLEIRPDASTEVLGHQEFPGTRDKDTLISPGMEETGEKSSGETWAPETVDVGIEDAMVRDTLIDPPIETESSDTKWSGPEVLLDDNGNPYRRGDDLIENNTYEMNGYVYETDYLGRIKCVEGEVHLREGDKRQSIKDNMETIGKGAGLPGDDISHLAADVLGGSNGLENLVPMDAKLNRGEYKSMELGLKKAVQNKQEVHLKVQMLYSNDTHRPSYFVATYRIDGETTVRIFDNAPRRRDV